MRKQVRKMTPEIVDLDASLTALWFRSGGLTREQVVEKLDGYPDEYRELFREKLNYYRNQVRVMYEQPR